MKELIDVIELAMMVDRGILIHSKFKGFLGLIGQRLKNSTSCIVISVFNRRLLRPWSGKSNVWRIVRRPLLMLT